ncbi:CHC2 zinc finger domain-containing protein [Myxococcus virescens]|uniref:CHC2 zinc finger domain-containing protein n=1 Tax=Myxococcus virescens TaxID=83456 RepID=UPI003DA486B4
MSFRAFVEQVRSRSDVADVVGAHVELRPSGSTLKGLSPFHPEKTPSFVVWPSTQTWRDFSNGGSLGGDVFHFVQEREKVGFKEAVFRLAERAGISPPSLHDESLARELEALVERREVERLLTAAADYYHRRLPAKLREESFSQHYGFTDEVVDNLKLGWADGGLFAHLSEAVGASREAALKTGLFVQLPGGRVEDFFRERLVFPYWKGGRVVYFIARATQHTREEAKYKKLLTHSERHPYVSPTVRNDYFYNEDAARKADTLLITEGVTDCISALQAGIACLSPATTRFRKQDIPRLLRLTRDARRVVICNDAEASGAGEAGARETAAALWAEGREACIALLPRPQDTAKVDVNALVTTHGAAALHEVLGRARGYPEYLLDGIPESAPKADLDKALAPLLAALQTCTAVRADVVLDAISAKFGLRRRALNANLKGVVAQREAEATAQRRASAARPEINVGNRQLWAIVTEARQAVVQANERRMRAASTQGFANEAAPLFVRGNALAQLAQPEKEAPILAEMTEAAVYGVLLREATWVAEVEGRPHSVFPPKDVARDFLAYPPPGLPPVEAVITTPVFGQDGKLLLTPGLHREDRLWLEPTPALHLGAVPERPTPEEVATARALFFDDVFVDFPFAHPSDKAHALAAVLLPFVRRMIEGCTPLHVVEAPAVGSGKGLLCDIVSWVATGRAFAIGTLPESEEEIRKTITAELALARPLILLDNANEKATLSSAALAAVLTSTSWTDRLLGKTQKLTLPNVAMWMLTGNNPRLSKDIARRSVRIRIDPKLDRAWTRTDFRHDPIIPWVKEHRSELVRAALTLVQAWIAAGKPLGKERLGSFEHWAAVMGGLLQVAGVEGFLGNLDELYANADVEGESWREFVQAWWAAHGAEEVLVSTLNELCEKDELMLQVRGEGGPRSQQSRLGRALQTARDRVFGDLRVVVRNQDRKKRTMYALQKLAGEPEVNTATTAAETTEVDPWA